MVYSKIFNGNPKSLGRVAVLFGGISAEREISLLSGEAVYCALSDAGVDAVKIDINENAVQQLLDATFDFAFIALHGCGGEDGKIQAVLDWLKIPYSGSGVSSSSLAMNKLLTKQVWSSIGLPTPKYQVLTAASDWSHITADLGDDIFVKPIHEGSSIGMSCVSGAEALQEAYKVAAEFDAEVLAETRVFGNEYSVPILNGVALAPISMRTQNTFYDYEAKYQRNDTVYECPCGLSEEKISDLKALAIKAFNAVGCQVWGRVDFMQDKEGNFYLLEVNTIPGMTEHSLVPMAAKVEALNFADLILEVVAGSQSKNV